MREGELVVDCQADIHQHLDTRFTVPLVREGEFPAKLGLNPVLDLDDERFVMITEFASSVFRRDIKERVGELHDQQDAIVRALDFLTGGF